MCQPLTVEILHYNISTKRSSNLARFGKISKSGDGGGSGDIFYIRVIGVEVQNYDS
jgi:hypothetical protein